MYLDPADLVSMLEQIRRGEFTTRFPGVLDQGTMVVLVWKTKRFLLVLTDDGEIATFLPRDSLKVFTDIGLVEAQVRALYEKQQRLNREKKELTKELSAVRCELNELRQQTVSAKLKIAKARVAARV